MNTTIQDFPSGQYQIILADPPWEYSLRPKDKTHRNRISYPSMIDNDILNLPVDGIAQEDSYLFLWSTKDHLELAFQCVQCWGFDYKNIFPWVKLTKAGNPRMGVGHWGRNCSEFLILGAKPKAKCFTSLGITNQLSLIQAERSKHSKKPEESFTLIERVAVALDKPKKIELFARTRRDGWDAWGDEIV